MKIKEIDTIALINNVIEAVNTGLIEKFNWSSEVEKFLLIKSNELFIQMEKRLLSTQQRYGEQDLVKSLISVQFLSPVIDDEYVSVIRLRDEYSYCLTKEKVQLAIDDCSRDISMNDLVYDQLIHFQESMLLNQMSPEVKVVVAHYLASTLRAQHQKSLIFRG